MHHQTMLMPHKSNPGMTLDETTVKAKCSLNLQAKRVPEHAKIGPKRGYMVLNMV